MLLLNKLKQVFSPGGETIIRNRYQRVHGWPLPETPRTFTQKLYHRMLDWHRELDPRYAELTDKGLVRNYVKDTIGAHYLPEVYWRGTDPDLIPWHLMAGRCVVLKPTHASGRVVIMDDQWERDTSQITAICHEWLKTNYYWHAREAQYYPIMPCLQIEEYLHYPDGTPPLDYKVWCFHGVPAMIQVIDHTKTFNSFFDTRWNLLDIRNHPTREPRFVPPPPNLDRLLRVASDLSRPFDFVRVDLYDVMDCVLFGELTFTPTAGTMRFQDDAWDLQLGDLWERKEN